MARAVAFIGKLKEIKKPEALDSIGPTIVRWLPKAAVVAVVLTLGVTGRAYWLKTARHPRSASRCSSRSRAAPRCWWTVR